MKKILCLSFLCWTPYVFSQPTISKPQDAANCKNQITDQSYCLEAWSKSDKEYPIYMRLYMPVYKTDFATVDSVFKQFLNFERYKEYLEGSGTQSVVVAKSVSLS